MRKQFIKSILAGAMAIAMTVGSMSVVAYAELAPQTPQKITIRAADQDGIGNAERFEAYQIFSGTVGTEGEGRELSNIAWGDGVEEADLVAAMKTDGTIGSAFQTAYTEYESSAKQGRSEAEFVAAFLEEHSGDASFINAFARLAAAHLDDTHKTTSSRTGGSTGDWEITVNPGYYIIKDTYASTGAAPDGSVSTYILEVVGPQTVDLKASIPTVKKEVESGKAALAETGETVHFTLTGTVANNIAEYATYKYEFKDTLPEGLSYDEDSVAVAIDGKTVKASGCYTVDNAGQILTVSFENLKAAQEEGDTPIDVTAASSVVVTYTAKLNKNATAGKDAGNENSVVLTYANNPYSAEATGATASVSAKVYTLSLKVEKVDKEDSPLQGSKFKLYKNVGGEDKYATAEKVGDHYVITGWGDEESATEFESETDGTFTVYGLSDGTYSLKETETPDNYLHLEDVKFVVSGGEIQADGALGDVSADLDASNKPRDDVEFEAGHEDGNMVVTLTNFKAPILPHTGGIGAMTVLGISLLGGVAGICLLVFGLRKKRDEE